MTYADKSAGETGSQANHTDVGGWLSSGRIRRQALLLSAALWLGYVATIAAPGMRDRFGHLKGADFLHAYVLGTVALERRGDLLYDAGAQREIGERRAPESAGDYFLPAYGPQYSLLWAPLALLPYAWATALWAALSAAIYGACCFALWKTCPNLQAYGGTVALATIAFPGFFALITFGQNSALALACFTGIYFALLRKREFWAGVCLGLLAFKPQLALVAAGVFLTACFWPEGPESADDGKSRDKPASATTRLSACKVVVGAAIALIGQAAAVWAWYGVRPFYDYAHALTRLGASAEILEPKLYLMHSLRAFWKLLLPWPGPAIALYLLTAFAALGLAISWWHRPVPLEHRFAAVLIASVLVAPHLTVYDLVILVPAFLWIADFARANTDRRLAWLLYLAYLLPFAGPLARWTHVQLSVISLVCLLVAWGRMFPGHPRSAGAVVPAVKVN